MAVVAVLMKMEGHRPLLPEGSTLPRAQSPFQPVGTGQGDTLKTHVSLLPVTHMPHLTASQLGCLDGQVSGKISCLKRTGRMQRQSGRASRLCMSTTGENNTVNTKPGSNIRKIRRKTLIDVQDKNPP